MIKVKVEKEYPMPDRIVMTYNRGMGASYSELKSFYIGETEYHAMAISNGYSEVVIEAIKGK